MNTIEENIEIIEGNILDYDKEILVQQVNCQGVMGGGLALQILKRYPEVPKEYKKYCSKRMKQATKTSELLGEVLYVDTYDGKIVANVFGQDFIRNGEQDKTVYTEEWALLKGIESIRNKAFLLNLSVGIPTYIGCGMANGDWESIRPKIEAIFEYSGVNVTFYHKR